MTDKLPKHLAHLHIFEVLRAELAVVDLGPVVRILDLGCGQGELMVYLQRMLPSLYEGHKVEVYGLDVVEHGAQFAEFLPKVLAGLHARCPEESWEGRIIVQSEEDPLAYPAGMFDAVVTNQVFEHARDKRRLAAEIYRVLRMGGLAVNIFPVKEIIIEPHIGVPLVHRICSWDVQRALIAWHSRLGGRVYRRHRAKIGVRREEYARYQADYITAFTHYASYRELQQLGASLRFRTSFRYTQQLYFLKLRRLLGLPVQTRYDRNRNGVLDWLMVKILKRVSIVTWILEKRNERIAISRMIPKAGLLEAE